MHLCTLGCLLPTNFDFAVSPLWIDTRWLSATGTRKLIVFPGAFLYWQSRFAGTDLIKNQPWRESERVRARACTYLLINGTFRVNCQIAMPFTSSGYVVGIYFRHDWVCEDCRKRSNGIRLQPNSSIHWTKMQKWFDIIKRKKGRMRHSMLSPESPADAFIPFPAAAQPVLWRKKRQKWKKNNSERKKKLLP